MVCDLYPDGSEGDDGFDQARLARFFRSRSERCPHRRTLFCRSGLPDRSHSQDDSDLRDQDPVGHSSRTSVPFLLPLAIEAGGYLARPDTQSVSASRQ